MGEGMNGTEPLVFPTRLLIPYTNYAGRVGSRFLREIRDHKRIMGMRCPQCERVYVPPRSTCYACFGQLDQWVEVGSTGTLVSFTEVHYGERFHPVAPPFMYGIVKLDGADTGLLHLLGEMDAGEVEIGMRLEAVFAQERKGSILDIEYFRPVAAGGDRGRSGGGR